MLQTRIDHASDYNVEIFEHGPMFEKALTKRERRLSKRKERRSGMGAPGVAVPLKNFQLRSISPLTEAQSDVFSAWEHGYNVFLHGSAGTGKTFISCSLALKLVMDESTPYDKIMIVRSVVPTRDIGFLPGSAKEKAAIYETPYQPIFQKLLGRGDAYEVMKKNGIVSFESTSFMRGSTFENTIIIVDEFQNCTFHELDSVITRIGDNCRLIFSGDTKQSDFIKSSDHDGPKQFMKIVAKMDSFAFISFGPHDIVRSDFVKEYILTKEAMISH